jgi:hypothetical protein
MRREIFSFANMRDELMRNPEGSNSLRSLTFFGNQAMAWREVETMEGTVREQMETEGNEIDKGIQGDESIRKSFWEKMRDYDLKGEIKLGIGLPLSRIYAEYFGKVFLVNFKL